MRSGGLGGLLGGLTVGAGGFGGLSSLGSNLNSILSGVLPGLPTTLTGLENSLMGVVNSLLPGLVQVQLCWGTFYTGIEGPYEALFDNTLPNLQNLGASRLADPFPFLPQFVANHMGYGQIIVAAPQTGDLQPISAIPGDIAHNLTNVIATLTNTSIIPVLDLSLLPISAALDNVIGLPVVLGGDLFGAPASTLQAADSSATAFATAVQAGNPAAAITALIDAPAVIANGFLNGQATFPYALNLSNLRAPVGVLDGVVSVVENLPLDGILVPPGYYAATVTVTSALNPVLPPDRP